MSGPLTVQPIVLDSRRFAFLDELPLLSTGRELRNDPAGRVTRRKLSYRRHRFHDHGSKQTRQTDYHARGTQLVERL